MRQQAAILQTFKNAPDAAAAQQTLAHHPLLTGTAWATDAWSLPMGETALLLGKKWRIEEAAD